MVRRYERVRVSLSISRLEDHKSYNKTVTVVSHHQPPTQYKFNLHINIYQLACSDTLRLRRRSNQTKGPTSGKSTLTCQNIRGQDICPSYNYDRYGYLKVKVILYEQVHDGCILSHSNYGLTHNSGPILFFVLCYQVIGM